MITKEVAVLNLKDLLQPAAGALEMLI